MRIALPSLYLYPISEMLNLSLQSLLSRLTFIHFRYYALSAAAALFKHIETKLNTIYAARSLRIIYTPVEGQSLVDDGR